MLTVIIIIFLIKIIKLLYFFLLSWSQFLKCLFKVPFSAGNDNVVLLAGVKEQQLMIDMTLIIPIAASALAVTVVIVAVCIWVLKAKSRRNLERGKFNCRQSVACL